MKRCLATGLLVLLITVGAYAQNKSDISPSSGASTGKPRVVSPEGAAYLQRRLKSTPFGAVDFDLEGLRTGMGERHEPTIKDIQLKRLKIGKIPCEWVLAPGADPDVRLLYLHGGGWVSGSGGNYLPLAADISVAARCAVLLLDYRLAPEHPFPAGLEDCIAAHDWLLANGPSGPAPARATFIAGDSAGGNLTLATLLALRDRKQPLPAGGIALSAATDFTLASESLKTVHDPIISARTMPTFRDLYLGKKDPRNPLASPVFGDYRGLPPLLIQVGEHEMLRDDSVRVAKKASADGTPVKFEVWPGMVHVFQIRGLPESRAAIKQIAEFMRSKLPKPIDIGSRRELFVDYHLIDEMKNLRLELNRPRNEGTVIRFDQPWEFPFAGAPTVIRDAEKYILIYRGMRGTGDGTNVESTCYAESKDGIHWTKPKLGLFEVLGSKENNCILANDPPFSHNFTPFLDTREGVDPEQRFKAVAGTAGSGGMFAFASPDAIHWRKLLDKPVITKGAFDSQNLAFWSEAEQKYLAYFRTFKNGKRWVSRSTSDDFLNWDEPVSMTFRHGDGPAPDEHIYTNGTHPYFRAPHLYIAMPFRFMPGRRALTMRQARAIHVHPNYANDSSDAILMTSRGGSVYDRTFLESFVRPDLGAENWVSRTNMPALNVVQTGDEEMSLFLECNYAQPTVHLKRFSLRLDGFASVRAGYDGGEMITRPLVFQGERLFINFATSAPGSVRVEIQDPDGKAIPGFTLDDAQEQIGNEIEREVSWKTGHDVSTLAGRPVRLRFVMKDADLYAMRFGPKSPPSADEKLREGLYTFDADSPQIEVDGVPIVSDASERIRFENGPKIVNDQAKAAVGSGSVSIGHGRATRERVEFAGTWNLGSNFTLAIFAKFEDLRWTRLFTNYRGGGPARPDELALSFDPTGAVAPGLVFSLKTKQIRSKALTLKPDHYYHFGVTHNDGDVRLYLDGEQVGKGPVPPGPVELNWDLAIGEDLAGGPNEQLRGHVDDVLILGRTLSGTEIKALSARRSR